MGVIVHTVSVTHQHHDSLTPWAPAVASLMTAFVAIVAIIVGAVQNSATRRIAARDSETRSAQLRIDLLEERFSAWKALDSFVWAWYEKVQAEETVETDGLLQLRDRVHFLFTDNIDELAMLYCASVQHYASARKRLDQYDLQNMGRAGHLVDDVRIKLIHDLSAKSFSVGECRKALKEGIRLAVGLHAV